MGAPGTGKTLLAKAVAGEANVPFSASLARNLLRCLLVLAQVECAIYLKSQKAAPCIVFIDEIDAVGRQRGAGLGGSHDEREQTLTKFWLKWMDLR